MLLPSSVGQELGAEEEGGDDAEEHPASSSGAGPVTAWPGGRPLAAVAVVRRAAGPGLPAAAAGRRGRRRRREVAHGAMLRVRRQAVSALARSSAAIRLTPCRHRPRGRSRREPAMPASAVPPAIACGPPVLPPGVCRTGGRHAHLRVRERGRPGSTSSSPERDPHGYDLCERHAARVGVPARLAARGPARPLSEPACERLAELSCRARARADPLSLPVRSPRVRPRARSSLRFSRRASRSLAWAGSPPSWSPTSARSSSSPPRATPNTDCDDLPALARRHPAGAAVARPDRRGDRGQPPVGHGPPAARTTACASAPST